MSTESIRRYKNLPVINFASPALSHSPAMIAVNNFYLKMQPWRINPGRGACPQPPKGMFHMHLDPVSAFSGLECWIEALEWACDHFFH